MASISQRERARLLYGPPGPSNSSNSSNPSNLSNLSSQTSNSLVHVPKRLASYGGSGSGQGFDAATTGRRLQGWQPTRLGPTTTIWGAYDLMLARCRDTVRNNPTAASAIDSFESQYIGNGIRPRWNIDTGSPSRDADLKDKIETEFARWVNGRGRDGDISCDDSGLLNFYGLQALMAREFFEAGELLTRFHVSSDPDMRVPLKLQMIEAEQMPIWLNSNSGAPGPINKQNGNAIRTGIEFIGNGNHRLAYHMYKQNPGETMFYPLDGITWTRIPAQYIQHTFKPLRAGQLRGIPTLTSALVLLHDLDKYYDAAVTKKQIQTMFAGFIEKVSADGDILPPDLCSPNSNSNDNQAPPQNIPQPGYSDLGTSVSHLETGTFQQLFPGESIKFPTLPQDNDIATFLNVMLHRFAASVGMTYEQVTGDLKGVTFSSIRAGVLDMRRKCEQLQQNIFIAGFCHPVAVRWLKYAVLSGALKLPGYATDPYLYEDITWARPKWDWVNPKDDVEAAQAEVRCGFTTRAKIVAERGSDIADVDSQTAIDNARADNYGLVHDTDPRRILIGRESNPEEAAPKEKETGEAVEGEEVVQQEQAV